MSGKKDLDKAKELEECMCYAKQRDLEHCPPVKNVTHPLRYYEFTQDEIKALEECDKESFYRRCLPLSTVFATLAFSGVKYGFLRKNRHFGPWPKVGVASIAGHLLGRVAYMPHCDTKLRELPDASHLGNTMRKYHEEKYPDPDAKKKKKK